MKIITSLILSLSIGSAIANDSKKIEHATQIVAEAKSHYENNPSIANKNNLDAALKQLSQLAKPVIIDESFRAQVAEVEPNGTSATASPIAPDNSGAGVIAPAADRDFWEISGVSVGDVVFVTIDTELSTTATDTEMGVFENDGSTLIEFDDDSGDGLSSAVVASIPTAGSIFVEFNEFGDNGTIEPYEMFQSVQPSGSIAAESEPNNDVASANTVSTLINTGDIAGDADFFSFQATAGDRLAVIVDNDPDGGADLTDIEISILDTDEITILANEAPFTVTSQNAAVFTAVNTGTHFIQITDGGSSSGGTNYQFVVVGSNGTVPVELQSFSVD